MSPSPLATTPPLAWQGLREIRILCLVAGGEPHRLHLQDELCRRVREIARDGAPVPVIPIGFGDPAILQTDVATLLVHASLQEGREPLLVIALRPFRGGGPDHAIFFGATPRALPLTQPGALPPGLDEALRAALAEILPWRQAD